MKVSEDGMEWQKTEDKKVILITNYCPNKDIALCKNRLLT